MEMGKIVLSLKPYCISTIEVNWMKNKFRWAVGIVICSNCNKKWVAVRPTKTKDEQLQCPNCSMKVKKILFI